MTAPAWALPPAPRWQPLAWMRATLREWGWVHTGLSLLVGSLSLFDMGGLLFYGGEFNLLRAWVYNVFEFGLPYVFWLRVADRAVLAGTPRWPSYAAVVLGVIAAGVWVVGPLLLPVIGGEAVWSARDDFALFLSRLLPYTMATLAYAHWRRGQQTLQRLEAAEVARAAQRQSLQAQRLLALQARVEPQFLFDTLSRVRDGIGTGSSGEAAEQAQAQALLADLIAYLRALQPAAGATASTVQREYALIQAYARTAGTLGLLPPHLLLNATAEAAHARLAPLVLLPLLRALVAAAPAAHWQVRAALEAADHTGRDAAARPARAGSTASGMASSSASSLCIFVHAAPGDWMARAALAALGVQDRSAALERLRAAHGERATLDTPAARPEALRLCVPYQAEAAAWPLTRGEPDASPVVLPNASAAAPSSFSTHGPAPNK